MMKKTIALVITGAIVFGFTGCGDNKEPINSEQINTENEQQSETEQNTEIKKVEIIDANDILTQIWAIYEDEDSDGNPYNDKFTVMGGHFDTAVMDEPAKYDLTQTQDLSLMYCVPESAIGMIDDAATMVHLMRASIFTAGVYHVTEEANVQSVVDGIKTQTLANQWLGGFPDDLIIMKIDEQYVVSAYGAAEVVEYFKEAVSKVYGTQVSILVEETIRK